ncbi:MAG: FecR family protein [Devosia sp.]|nr:FecR family protein [Devosia sp.]
MQKLVFGLVVCTVWFLTQGSAMAASGTAMGVDPQAEARAKAETRLLVVGSDIFIGDRVVTGASGQVQIKFDDRTELVVGPNSSLLIEDYLLREDGSAGKLALSALAGTFRFVTGGAPKDRYLIKTPTGTIGVRGTAFELYVTALRHFVLQLHGSTINCNERGDKCFILNAMCELGEVSADDAVVIGDTDDVTGAERARLRQMFIYAVSQRPLLREFRVDRAERCLNKPPSGGGADSLSDPGVFVPPDNISYNMKLGLEP